ncbi:hypothetical protein CAEBREN_17676 [Caenorhabditis brenneri]|uniref:Uncharacterized protein n=1 Tax=Caenorhabditis brenneri TaxID=135651 RepID=G0MUT6_CAEBE|nr:hypothetical protein CAEBREN_17676 [Caenorhabditis brenneri]
MDYCREKNGDPKNFQSIASRKYPTQKPPAEASPTISGIIKFPTSKIYYKVY